MGGATFQAKNIEATFLDECKTFRVFRVKNNWGAYIAYESGWYRVRTFLFGDVFLFYKEIEDEI